MDISELNQYLIANVKRECGDFLSSKPFEDEYDRYRRDAAIYCYSGMFAIVKQCYESAAFVEMVRQQAADLYCEQDEDESRESIARKALASVTGDHDDICDEQSVGWYIGRHTYEHCLAYDSFDYKPIFLAAWNEYFSLEFQNRVRGIKNDIGMNVSEDEIMDYMQNSESDRERLINYKWDLIMGSQRWLDDDEYLDSCCEKAKDLFDTTAKTKDDLLCLTTAVSLAYAEVKGQILWPVGLCIVAKKILSK